MLTYVSPYVRGRLRLTLLYSSHFAVFELVSFCMAFISQVQIKCFYGVMAAVTNKRQKTPNFKDNKVEKKSKAYNKMLFSPPRSGSCVSHHFRGVERTDVAMLEIPLFTSMLAEPLLQFPSSPSGFIWKHFVLAAACRLYKGHPTMHTSVRTLCVISLFCTLICGLWLSSCTTSEGNLTVKVTYSLVLGITVSFLQCVTAN